MKRKGIFWGLLFVILTRCISAQASKYAVEVSAVAGINPNSLVFSWTADPAADHYYVFKKEIEDSSWGEPISVISGSSTEFTDYNINSGEGFEYGFYKNLNFFQDTIYVDNGKSLTFRIYDTWGDGIGPHHGLGWFKVNGYYQIYAQGDSFGHVYSITFTVDGGDTVTQDRIILTVQTDIFADETSWAIEDNTSGVVLDTGGPYEPPRFGHIFAGINYPPIEYRGTVLLLIDDYYLPELEYELGRLKVDLVGDGWKIKQIEVNRNDPVTLVKNLIINQCQSDSSINTLFIIGHVPVPYSGNVQSAHSNHCGAWPADLYYAELDDNWTDSVVNNTSATRPANHNVPGDGKFDQTLINSGVDLCVGRVDLYDMPAFTGTDIELLRNYLDKDHNYRQGYFLPERRGLIDDNVGGLFGVAPAANGLRNFSAMFTADSVFELDYFNTMQSHSYLWSMGCGGGSYNSCGGVGTTADFASRTVQSVFTILYGSYFGDWDNPNNLLRAPLGSDDALLTCCWAGAPNWHFHHMALGFTIGYSARLSQNNIRTYAPTDRAYQIHTALMGDPTLRLHVVSPPYLLNFNTINNSIQLSWTKSADSILGYYIYRSDNLENTFTRITNQFIETNQWIDSNPLSGNNVYMVRAVKLEISGSGTYYNLSQGIIDSVNFTGTGIEENQNFQSNYSTFLFENYPDPFENTSRIDFQLEQPDLVHIAVFDLLGREVVVLLSDKIESGMHSVYWNGLDRRFQPVKPGIYFYQMTTGSGYSSTQRMILLK